MDQKQINEKKMYERKKKKILSVKKNYELTFSCWCWVAILNRFMAGY